MTKTLVNTQSEVTAAPTKLGGSAGVAVSSLNSWDEEFEQDDKFTLARLVLNHVDPVATLRSRRAQIADDKVFNVNLKGVSDKDEGKYPGPRVNQKSSGRCWLFAATNVLRYNVIEQLKLGDFQLSQSYLYFYDKLEKANYYLENVLELVDEPLEGRLMSFFNTDPMGDGGQWDMAYNLLDKYGIVPASLYPESFSSSSSSRMCWLLTAKLREYTIALRKAVRPTSDETAATAEELQALKTGFMREIYATLCITLGTPPKPDDKVTWEYYDKDNKFHSWTGTPLQYYSEFCERKDMAPKDSFSLINDPRNEYGRLYTVKRLGNVWGGPRVRYVNIPIEELEDAVVTGIKANTPLFFGCDVGKFMDGKAGILDTALFQVSAAFPYKFNSTKAERLVTGESCANHAMVITAVHVDEATGRPVRYKIENSWSDESGEKGWYMGTADWFREYVYQVVIPRSVAETKWVEVLDQEPAELEPWDPMGALAGK